MPLLIATLTSLNSVDKAKNLTLTSIMMGKLMSREGISVYEIAHYKTQVFYAMLFLDDTQIDNANLDCIMRSAFFLV
jgi:hypothetical protein